MSLSDPKSVSAAQQVRKYADEKLTVSSGKLFCTACCEELSFKKNVVASAVRNYHSRRNVVASHVQSAKHNTGKTRLVMKEAQ